jgi:hypothetical protein
MRKFISGSFYPFLILALVGYLAFSNYVPGTWLSGWDTLHPEFNFSLYFGRIFSGAWQEHQGVGAAAAQSHAAELTRVPFTHLLSLVFPDNMVRYIFIFMTLAVGALGVYFLTKYILSMSSDKSVKPAAFIASAFYLLNLATLQQYFDPLEMFTVHFASLPWLFLTAIKYLREGGRRNLIWFSLTTLLASSAAHTATLFYVYLAMFGVYVLMAILIARNKIKFKRGIALLSLTLLLNLFWLGPNLYYVFREAATVSHSHISETFSTEAFLQSRAFGDIKSLGLLKNFPFGWREFDFAKGSFEDQMAPWTLHLSIPSVEGIGYAVSIIASLGIFFAFLRKSKYAVSFLPITGLCVVFWINENPPFTPLFVFLRQQVPLFAEALRFPFTKFSIMLVLCLSVFLAFSSQFILRIFAKARAQFLLVALFVAALIYFMLPAFNGHLIDSSMRVRLPDEYFQAFDWFNHQNHDARVAKLPLQTFWNWVYYSWGYQGGGFTWFGIPQPTFDREFDRWGLYNEDFYFQAATALYSGNAEAFENTLRKYQVKYILLDESVVNPGGSSNLLYIPQTKDLIAKLTSLREVAKFNFLTIYETDFEVGDKYISAPTSYIKTGTDMTYAKVDPIYATFGDYIEGEGANFPFVNLDKRAGVRITAMNVPPATSSGILVFKNTNTTEQIALNISNVIKTDLSKVNGFENAHNCDIKNLGKVERDITADGVLYRAEDGGVSCDYINFPNLKYSQAYVLRIAGENKEGRSLKIYLTNYTTERADLEELLPEGKFDEAYFVYPTVLDGTGYTLNLETRSYGRITAENLVTKVELYPVNYASLAAYPNGSWDAVQSIQNNLKILDVRKYGTWGYRIRVTGDGLLELGQGFERGWVAFQVKAKPQILSHLKIDSWANGWMVPSGGTIFVFFWPQLLEWGGMVLAAAFLTRLIFRLY